MNARPLRWFATTSLLAAMWLLLSAMLLVGVIVGLLVHRRRN